MIKLKKIGLLALIITLAIVGAACGSSSTTPSDSTNDNGPTTETKNETTEKKQEKVTIRFAHEEGEQDLQGLYASRFKELIEARDDVNIDVQVFPVGTLGTDLSIAEQLQQGAVQMAISSPGTTGNLVPEAQFVALKFLFSDNMEVNDYVLNNSKALNETLAGQYLNHNMKVLHFWQEGFNSWTSNRPIEKPSDFKGFKMRTQTSPLMVKSYEVWDANPTALDWSEVFSAIQLGTIDGQENPDFWVQASGVYELQDHLIVSAHSIYITSTVVNKDFYESQSPEVQKAITETIDELRTYATNIERELNVAALKEMKASGKTNVITLTEEQRAEFRKTSESTYQDYVDLAGGKAKEIIEQLVKEIEEAEGKF
jgi:C4-dicarboxylate-binding protein DctP